MAINGNNVLVGYATLFLAPVGTGPVVDTLPLGADWGVVPASATANSLTASSAIGATSISLLSTVTLGQTLAIDNGAASEIRVAGAVTGTGPYAVVISPPLEKLHLASAPVYNGTATAWKAPGATEAGVTLSVNSQTTDINVEEQAIPVMVLTTSKQVQISLALSEDTIANMKYAYGGGTISIQAAATGVPGKTVLTLADDLEYLACGLEGVNGKGMPRRIYIPRMISAGQVQSVYRRAANNRSYSVTLRAVCPASQVQITDITAVAL